MWMARSGLQGRLSEYIQLTRLNRPIGILLLLWPTLWALWVAGAGQPPAGVVVVFVLGVVLMRSAGCVINDFADRHIDPHVRRTRDRPLAARRVAPAEAILLFSGLVLLAFCLVLTQNPMTVQMSLVALALAVTYPFMKRLHHLPQVHLGAAFGWAVPMAFAAIGEQVPAQAWLLFAATLFWAVAYDTEYAMVDREDDLRIGVRSSAILFGRLDRLIIATAHGLALVLLYLTGVAAGLGLLYHLGLMAAGLMALHQQWLIRQRQPDACFRAFLSNNNFGCVVFLGMIADYLWATLA